MRKVPAGCCRRCLNPVPRGRRSWCSEDCIEQHMIRNQPAHARRRVLERDHGVCATCGRDCEALETRISDYAARYDTKQRERQIHFWKRTDRLRAWFRRFGLVWGNSLWQADHIIPVVEGGGGCGLDGLRTLCVCCHKKETRTLAARLAVIRKRRRAWDVLKHRLPVFTMPTTAWEEFELLAVDVRL